MDRLNLFITLLLYVDYLQSNYYYSMPLLKLAYLIPREENDVNEVIY